MRRLRWALIGALWMGICLALHAAFDEWIRYRLSRSLMPEPGPDGEFPPPDSLWEMFDNLILVTVMPKMVFPVLAFGILTAGWWIIKRWQTKRAQVSES